MVVNNVNKGMEIKQNGLGYFEPIKDDIKKLNDAGKSFYIIYFKLKEMSDSLNEVI